MIDLLKCHGRKYRAMIHGKAVEGRISVNNEYRTVFLCQNIYDGATALDRLGYKYSWGIVPDRYVSSRTALESNGVTNFELIDEAPDEVATAATDAECRLMNITHLLTI